MPDPDGPSDDRCWLVAARAGDHEAGARLVRLHAASMMRIAQNVTGRYAGTDADDVVQEAFVAALTTDTLPTGDVGAWLRAIAARKALDGLRRRARRSEHPLPDAEPAGGQVPPGEGVLGLRRALARVSAADRAVLTLIDLEGLTMAEAARALGATTMAVKWRAVRARRRLRALLDGEPPAGGARS